MKLSIVSTMYRSAPFLAEFCQRMLKAANQITDDYELILVNDGSPDDSLDIALDCQTNNSQIQIVDLSRNFGHHTAIMAGIEHAQGDLIYLIDCDLEEQPEWLPQFMVQMEQTDSDVIYGVQQQRTASRMSNFFAELFWKSLNIMSSVKIPYNPMTCRLMKRTYVDELLNIGDRVLYLAGVFAWAGFKQQSIALTKTPRPLAHKSTYNLSKKLLQVADSFSSFSVAPLSLIFLIGLVIWIGSVAAALYLLVEKLIHPEAVLSGFTSVMLSIWFLSGTIIIILGIIALYIAKIFQEVKRRPLYIAKRVYRGTQSE